MQENTSQKLIKIADNASANKKNKDGNKYQ